MDESDTRQRQSPSPWPPTEPTEPPTEPPGTLRPPGAPQGYPTTAGWAAPPPPRRRSRLAIVVGVIVVGVVALIAVGAVLSFLQPSQAGKVVFVTTEPKQGDSCHFNNTVTTINAGTHAWVVIVFREKMDDQPVSVTLSYNGESLAPIPYAVSDTKGLACIADRADLGIFPAGTWKFTVTHRGETEAEGTLTIK